MTDMDERARAVLRQNDRGGFTVPRAGLYPFQWNWDSCLSALGFATFDAPRAMLEIETLLSGQWADGMVPHIVFHRPDPGYFPGPERWGTEHVPATSGISQPPVMATCLARLLDAAPELEARATALLPKVLAYHRWFHKARDPDGTGLVTTIHPWETGMDNSPAWDEALARIEVAADLEPYTRRDTQHVDAAQRPTSAEYDRYMTLVQLFKSHGWRHEIETASPFRIQDVGTCCILLRADKDLRRLAQRLGQPDLLPEIDGWIERATHAAQAFAHPETGHWHSIDLLARGHVATPTHAGFLAFWAGLGSDAMAKSLARWLDAEAFGISTIAVDHPRFEPQRYWRGPVWAITNFMIGQGLAESDQPDLASRVQGDTRALIEKNGFFEYFDPLTGQGYGGDSFTWTAAMWLAWAGR